MFLTKQSIFSGKLQFIVLVAGLTGVLFGSNVMAEDPAPAGSEYVLNSILEIEPPMSERACFDSITTANERLITACIGTDDSGAVDFQIEANIFEKNSSGEFQQIYRVQLPTVSTIRPAIEQNISVRADGPWLIVAVPEERGDSFPNNGAVYVYKQAPDGISYDFVEKLLPQPEPYMPSDGFGIAIDIEEDRLIIKSAVENSTSSFLYSYQFDGISWILQNKTPLDSGYTDAYLKQSLVIDGETIYVSANNLNQFSGTGEIHIFEYDAGMSEWMFKQALAAEYNPAPGYFGQEFVVEGDTIIALVSDTQVRSESSAPVKGKITIFSRPDQYAPWGQTGEILSPGIYPDTEGFGLSLLLKGDELLVGAPKANTFTGTVYQYTFDEMAGSWNYIREVLPAEVMPESGFGDNLLGINSTSIIVGAPGKELWQQGEYYPGYGYVLSTEVAVQDTDGDGDGMPDQWEIDNGLDPYYADADYDFDGDSLTNLEEYTAGLNPHHHDTDSDGMSDGWEVQNGLNPLEDDAQLDSDEDGVSNLDEFLAGTNPNDEDDYSQIIFKSLSTENQNDEVKVCDVSSSGELILGGKVFTDKIYTWDNDILKTTPYLDGECISISDDGKIVMRDHYMLPIMIEGMHEYDWISYPSDFIADSMFSEISGDGNVIVGRVNDKAAIWDSEEVVEILADTDREYLFNVATGASYDGEVIVGMADYDDDGQIITMPFRWTKDLGVEQLECETGSFCEVRGVSDDGSVVIGAVFGGSGSYGVWWNRYGVAHKLEKSDDGQKFYPSSVSRDGRYILGSTDDLHESGEAFIWERDINKVSLLKDWLIERERLIGSPIGDFHSWQLTSVSGISADGNVIVGNGTDSYGNRKAWSINIRYKDDDNDGIVDVWELEHGLSPEDAADADMDFDDDGLTNAEEYQLGSNLMSEDSDSDGMPDGWEHENGLDVNAADNYFDIDSDLVSNVDEYRYATDPNDSNDFPEAVFGAISFDVEKLHRSYVCGLSADGTYSSIWGEFEGYNAGAVWQFGKSTLIANEHFSPCAKIANNGQVISYMSFFDAKGNEHQYPQDFYVDDMLGGISADGRVIAGSYLSEAAIWDGENITSLLDGAGVNKDYSVAIALSNDGSVVAGQYDHFDEESGKTSIFPFRWTLEGSVELLPCENAAAGCTVTAISADGSVVIGYTNEYEKRGIWWDSNGEIHYLNDEYDTRSIIPISVSGNGAIIVGKIGSVLNNMGDSSSDQAFVWTKSGGLMSVEEWMEMQGSDPFPSYTHGGYPVNEENSIVPSSVRGISADGSVLVGNGFESGIEPTAWMIRIVRKDTDSDGMPDTWEMENGLDPYYPDADIDFDFDGLDNLAEYQNGTDPQNPDTDGDGVPDGWEVQYGFDPLSLQDPNDSGDKDGDSLMDRAEYFAGTNPTDVDTDGDTMLDGWEYHNGLNPTDSADTHVDSDGDGVNNITEFQNGTNPQAIDTDGDTVPDGWEIEYGFDPLAPQDPNDSGDKDGDSLMDRAEYFAGTNPTDVDTDGDTMLDGWEYHNGLNPTDSADTHVDSDGDGVNNITEFQNGTNPQAIDTDGDTVPDGWEIEYGFDPLAPQDPNDSGDKDGDSLMDRAEYFAGTNPTNADTDGDTMPDGWEVQNGLNPTSSADAVADEDLDGLTNLQEFQNGTNLRAADTDADGIPDGAELGFGLNPLDPADAALDADGDGMSNLEEYTKGFDPKSANQSPEVSITLPTENIQVVEGGSVELNVEANDAEDGVLTSAVAWSSDLDGELGDGASQTTVLSVGVHNITATVVDSFGAANSDQVAVEVLANQASVVTITQPVTDTVTPEGTLVDFAANASDSEDGDLSAAIAWSSSIDGALGTGTDLSLSLSVGTHVISATVEDSHGEITTSEVTLIVEPFVATEFPAGDSLPELWTTDAAKGWSVDYANAAEGEKSLRSGAITHNESSTMTVSGDFAAGEVTFQLKVSSEAKYDFLRFYDNGVKVAEWAGNLDWQQYSYSLPAGEHTLVWAYEKDSSASKYEDSVWIDAVSLPDFTPISDAEKFVADGQIPQDWTTTSPAWTVDSSTETIDGMHSLRSGDITHRESSAIEVTRDIAAGDMTFYYKVSSEAWYDYLYFYIDGEFVEKWTGDVSWTQQRYTLSAGTHTFKWVYMKDHSVDKGEDAAWIDKVVFPE